MKNFVVIGSCAASISFISKLRSFDQGTNITCLTLQEDVPYNRCLLADFLTHDKSLEQLALKSATFFDDQHVTMLYRCPAVVFNFEQKKVAYEHNGQRHWIDYDVLFLGMGTSSFVPASIQKQWCDGMFKFHTLSDMKAIDQFLQTNQVKSVVVLGAGINGLEAASALCQKGLHVTIIEKQSRVAVSQFNQTASDWVQTRLESSGIIVRTGVECVNFNQRDGKIESIQLNDGSIIDADMVIVATGSKVNSDLLQNTGMALENNCVVVNRRLQTNITDVYAAGDLCAAPTLHGSDVARSTTWSDAMLQGLCAATNFSDSVREYVGIINLRDSFFCGMDLYACGQTVGHAPDVEIIAKRGDQFFKQWFLHEGRLIGFLLIGDIGGLALFKQWYMNRVVVDLQQLV